MAIYEVKGSRSLPQRILERLMSSNSWGDWTAMEKSHTASHPGIDARDGDRATGNKQHLRIEVKQISHYHSGQYAKSPARHRHPVDGLQKGTPRPVTLAPSKRGSIQTPLPKSSKSRLNDRNALMAARGKAQRCVSLTYINGTQQNGSDTKRPPLSPNAANLG